MHRDRTSDRRLASILVPLVTALPMLGWTLPAPASSTAEARQPPPTRPAAGPARVADGGQGLVVLAGSELDCCCTQQAGGQATVAVTLNARAGQVVDATGTTAVLHCIMSQCTPGDPERNVVAWRYTYDAVVTDGKFRITEDGTLELLSGTAFIRSQREPCLMRAVLKVTGYTYFPLLLAGQFKAIPKGTEILAEVFVDGDGNPTETRITLVRSHEERGEKALIVWVDNPDDPKKPRETVFAEGDAGQFIRASIDANAPGDRRVPDATTRAEIDAKVIEALRALSR